MNSHYQTRALNPKYRPDIDGLRAIAVMSVVFFHAFPFKLPGGFIGVDIFFVISGFLISSILLKNLKQDTFSIADFYERRIRRIFPALLIVLAATYSFGWLTLLADEYKQLGKEIAGGAGFVSNFILWSDSGYFDRKAELKPLLHLWSLGIEEQFYLIWPLLLWAAWKQKINLFLIITGITAASFAFNIFSVSEDAVATYYSPITRFWELLAGAALAYIDAIRTSSPAAQGGTPTARALHRSSHWRNVQSKAGVLLIYAAAVLLDKHRAFPGFWALLPVAGAVLIISAGQHAWVNRILLSNRIMVGIGLISYPLYLWHWPLLSYLRIMEGGAEASRELRFVAVCVAIMLAWLTYSVIEKPVRRTSLGGKLAPSLGISMLVVGGIGLATMLANGIESRRLAEATVALSKESEDHNSPIPSFSDGKIDIQNAQFVGQDPDAVLFVGDSLMAHYGPRLKHLYGDADTKPPFSSTFAARPGCRPIPSGERINSNGRDCDAYYVALMELARQHRYKRIVFSASWELVFSDLAYRDNAEKFASDLITLKKLGKDIYFIGFAPHHPKFDLISISRDYRLASIKRATVQSRDLWISRDSISPQRTIEYKRMIELAARISAKIIDPFDYFCTADRCLYFTDGKPLYADEYHIRASTAITYAIFIDRLIGL